MAESIKMPCRDINQLEPILRRGAQEFLNRCAKNGLNVLITQTYRSAEYQAQLYAQGRTTPGSIVTSLSGKKGGESPHQFRIAFDICKNVKGHEYDDDSFFSKCGAIWRDMGGTWGGNWKPQDKPHFEYTAGKGYGSFRNGWQFPADAKMPWETVVPPKAATIKEDVEVVDQTKIKVDDKVYTVNRILKDGNNYVKLQDLKAAGFTVDYDAVNKLPVLYSPKNR